MRQTPETSPSAPPRVAVQVCPYLGLVDDPATACYFASPDHRCQALGRNRRIPGGGAHQRLYCLTPEYAACPRYWPVDPAEPSLAPLPPRLLTGRRIGAMVLLAALIVGAGLAAPSLRLPSIASAPASAPPTISRSQAPVAPTTTAAAEPTRTARVPTPTSRVVNHSLEVLRQFAAPRTVLGFSRPLEMGESSEDVRALQERLRELGYLREEATGYFGALTRTALSQFQAAQGLPATGIADAATVDALNQP